MKKTIITLILLSATFFTTNAFSYTMNQVNSYNSNISYSSNYNQVNSYNSNISYAAPVMEMAG